METLPHILSLLANGGRRVTHFAENADAVVFEVSQSVLQVRILAFLAVNTRLDFSKHLFSQLSAVHGQLATWHDVRLRLASLD